MLIHQQKDRLVGFLTIIVLLWSFISVWTKASNAQSVHFSIPANLTGTAGDTVMIPLNINLNGRSIGSLDATVGFNNTLLIYTGFAAGPIVPTSLGWKFDVNGNNASGIVSVGAVDLVDVTNRLNGSGTAVFLKFVVSSSAMEGDTSDLPLSGLAATDTLAIPLPASGTGGRFTVSNAMIDTVVFSVPSNLQASPGDTVQIPLNIDPNGKRIGSFDATVGFKTTMLTYTGFTAGPVVPMELGWRLDVNSDNTNGKISVGALDLVEATSGLTGSGPAVFLKFVVNYSAGEGDMSILALSGLAATDTNAVSLQVKGAEGKFTVRSVPPIAPTELIAVAISSSQITLAWQDNATNETGYKVERTADLAGNWAEVASLGANITSYSNTGLIDGALYYYRVHAFNTAGKSGYSNVDSDTTFMNPPSDFVANAATDTQINLSWLDNSESETGYRIERKTGTGGTFTEIAVVGADITTYNDTGLLTGTTYYYRMRGYNALVTSSYSNEAGATTKTKIAAVIRVDPTSWNYGKVIVGNDSDKIFVLSNDGNDTLKVSNTSISDSEDFKIPSGGAPFAISPNSAHQLTIRFMPNTSGEFSGTLRIASNDPDKNPFEVSLRGTGEPPPPKTYAFPNPFNPEAAPIQIHFIGDDLMGTAIKIFDGHGNLVQTLSTLAAQTTTTGKIIAWDGRNVYGDFVVNGIYFYVIESGTSERRIGKIAVLR